MSSSFGSSKIRTMFRMRGAANRQTSPRMLRHGRNAIANLPSVAAASIRRAITTSTTMQVRAATGCSGTGRQKKSVKELEMAHASKKKIGPGAHGKGAGVGGLTNIPKEKIGDNQVLSNRDKKQHSHERGQDSR